MDIENIEIYNNVMWIWVKGKSFKKYLICYDLDRNVVECSCVSYQIRKRCKHIRMLKTKEMRRLIEMAKKRKTLKIETKFFPSSVNALNNLYDSGFYVNNLINGIAGTPNIGKSLLALQDSFWFVKNKMNVLYIDLEGSLLSQLENWEDIFLNRFEIEYDEYAERFLIEDSLRDIKDLFRYFGYELDINLKGEKVELNCSLIKRKNAKYECDLEKDIVENNVKFLVLDSISNVVRMAIPSNTQNYPAKSFIEAKILERLLKLQAKYGLYILVILQASLNPTNPYENKFGVRGGVSVRHNVKRLVGIKRREKGDVKNYRQFWLIRGENAPEWSKVTIAKICDLGYVDVKEDEINISDVLTKSEIERVGNV